MIDAAALKSLYTTTLAILFAGYTSSYTSSGANAVIHCLQQRGGKKGYLNDTHVTSGAMAQRICVKNNKKDFKTNMNLLPYVCFGLFKQKRMLRTQLEYLFFDIFPYNFMKKH